jgi:TRAP-type C4-dicarboxylate transport system substrate-binding protein
VSKKFWDSISPTEQKMLRDSFLEGRDYQKQQTIAAAGKSLEELKAKGMQFNEIVPAEIARIREAARPVADKFSADLDQARVTLFKSELARVQKL